MKYLPITTILVTLAVVLSQHSQAQDAPRAVSDPPELATKREEYLRAMQRASVPILTNYLRQLEPLKEQFTRGRDLQAALSVDGEITKVKQQLDAANATAQGARSSVNLPTEITSAIWQGPEPTQSKDVTAHLKKLMDSGIASIPVNSKDAAGGADPAPYKRKTLILEYSVNGKVKRKTLGEGDKLNFRDLK